MSQTVQYPIIVDGSFASLLRAYLLLFAEKLEAKALLDLNSQAQSDSPVQARYVAACRQVDSMECRLSQMLKWEDVRINPMKGLLKAFFSAYDPHLHSQEISAVGLDPVWGGWCDRRTFSVDDGSDNYLKAVRSLLPELAWQKDALLHKFGAVLEAECKYYDIACRVYEGRFGNLQYVATMIDAVERCRQNMVSTRATFVAHALATCTAEERTARLAMLQQFADGVQ
jgi:hypothetical protein